MMFSSSLIMVYMAPCFKELLPFVNDNSLFYTNLPIAGASVSHGHISSLNSVLALNRITVNDLHFALISIKQNKTEIHW